MFAPILPFVTEEIYQMSFKKFEKEDSIHLSSWPGVKKVEESDDWNNFKEILSKIRQEKSNAKKSMRAEVKIKMDGKDMEKLDGMIEDLKDVTNAVDISKGKFKVEFV